MGYRVEDDCVGCDHCIDCGRKHIKIHYCDVCDDDVNELFYDLNGREVCWDCFKEQFMSKICDDMDEDRCAQCGTDAEELFQIDGEWVCNECLEELAEKVDMED